MIAGVLVVHFGGLLSTAREYGIAVIILAGAALLGLLTNRPTSNPGPRQLPTSPQERNVIMTRQARKPGPDHPITIEANTARVIARVGDTVIADTTSALTLREASYPPVHYIPLADVDPTVLRHSPTQTYCPYKGDASYYHLVLPDQEFTDAVWTYQTPYPAMSAIAGHVAFYADRVTVEEEHAVD